MLANDIHICVCQLNTSLRDFYEDLEQLCDDLEENIDELCARLEKSGYQYNREQNRIDKIKG